MTSTLTDTPTDTSTEAPTERPAEAASRKLRRTTIGHPTVIGTLLTLLARDLTVLRRNFRLLATRAIVQPFAFVFVFAYVLPKIGFDQSTAPGQPTFSTILVPGLVAVTVCVQSLMAVMQPLMTDFSYNMEIEDRAMAPVPISILGVQKIISGALQGLAASLVVWPVLIFVHAKGQAPSLHVTDWPLFIVILVASALLASSVGLLFGTIIDVGKAQQLLAVFIIPMTMLGCVYFPWTSLHSVRWLQVLTCINPLVYMSEGMRSVLTPKVAHMPWWGLTAALAGGLVLFGTLALNRFSKRIVK